MARARIGFAGAAFAVACACFARGAGSAPDLSPPVRRTEVVVAVEPARSFKLANGLSVVLQRGGSGTGEVDVSMLYDVGAFDDPPGYSGMAHLVEHLTYRGSRHLRPLEAFSALERIGARDINGETFPTKTVYHAAVPSEQLETALWIESERMAFTLEKFEQRNLDVERRIVENELRLRGGLDFADYVLRAIFPEGHRYHHLPASFSDLEAIRVRDVQWFFQKWYRPDNATLTLYGDLDGTRAEELVRKYFEPVVAPLAPFVRPSPKSVDLPAIRRLEVAAPVAPPRMAFVWFSPKTDSPDGVTLSFVATALRHRLLSELVTDARLASRVTVTFPPLGETTLFWLEIELAPRTNSNDVDSRVTRAVQRLQAEPIGHAEIEEVRALYATGVVTANDDVRFGRSLRAADEWLKAVLAVDPKMAMRAARDCLPLGHRLVALLATSRTAPGGGEVRRVWDER